MAMHYPTHLAIIPDGNRTRAQEHGYSNLEGHAAGQKNSLALAKYVFEQTPISVLTLRGLSTENLRKRSQEELDYLCELYKIAIDDVKDLLVGLKVSFYRVGNSVGLPKSLLDFLNQTQKEISFAESEKAMVIGVNYGGRDEIIRGIRGLTQEECLTLTEEAFSQKLDFGAFPPVDLVIRTKGDAASRLSGFMLWWIGYAELFFSRLKFPAFGVAALQEALKRYDSIIHGRNFGK